MIKIVMAPMSLLMTSSTVKYCTMDYIPYCASRFSCWSWCYGEGRITHSTGQLGILKGETAVLLPLLRSKGVGSRTARENNQASAQECGKLGVALRDAIILHRMRLVKEFMSRSQVCDRDIKRSTRS